MNEAEYTNLLRSEFDIDLSTFRQKNGGLGAIYSETAYLMSKLISHPSVERVFEAGAGLSSMIYATVAKQHGKFFVSMEDKEEWADKFNANLRGVPELVGDFQVVRTESDPAKCPKFEEPFQVAWIDGNLAGYHEKGIPPNCLHRPGSIRYYKDVMMDALIIFDDGQDTHCRKEIDKVMVEMGRDPGDCFIWNPTNRFLSADCLNRHQWICPPSSDHPLLEVLKSVGEMW